MKSPSRHSVGRVLGIGVLLIGSTLFFKYAQAPVPLERVMNQEAQVQQAADVVMQEAPPPEWRIWFPQTSPMTIGGVSVEASVARTREERARGLSDTPYLPEEVVKLFVFEVAGSQEIWMKDMRYPLDILWLDASGKVVHIEENVTPDTYPRAFGSPVPAWYVVEAAAGFAARHAITLGSSATLPEALRE